MDVAYRFTDHFNRKTKNVCKLMKLFYYSKCNLRLMIYCWSGPVISSHSNTSRWWCFQSLLLLLLLLESVHLYFVTKSKMAKNPNEKFYLEVVFHSVWDRLSHDQRWQRQCLYFVFQFLSKSHHRWMNRRAKRKKKKNDREAMNKNMQYPYGRTELKKKTGGKNNIFGIDHLSSRSVFRTIMNFSSFCDDEDEDDDDDGGSKESVPMVVAVCAYFIEIVHFILGCITFRNSHINMNCHFSIKSYEGTIPMFYRWNGFDLACIFVAVLAFIYHK